MTTLTDGDVVPVHDDLKVTIDRENPGLQSSDNGTTSNPNEIHTRTGENAASIWVWALAPLVLHFLSVLILTIIIKTSIDGQGFSIEGRYTLARFSPLQSDITTGISSGVAIVRFFAAMWSASMLWRCIFILMERGGLSLEQINTLLTWQVHLHPRRQSSRKTGLLISIILVAAFPSQLSGPILTGSITWSSSYGFSGIKEIVGVENHNRNQSDEQFAYNFPLNLSASPLSLYSVGRPLAASYSATAWQGSQESERTMKRVVRDIDQYPINSTLDNITLPYFSVSKLEWISDPMKEFPRVVLESYNNNSDWNPFRPIPNYLIQPGTFALLPDSWGVAPPDLNGGIVSETRTVIGSYALRDTPGETCSASPFGNAPANIGLYHVVGDYHCYIYGRITYVAGAAECKNCRLSSWHTVQNDTSLTVSPSLMTTYALAMMPVVGELTREYNVSLASAFNNLDGYVAEFLIRSYAASWTHLTRLVASPERLPTYVHIAVPMTRANVLWWRVVLWLSLNLLFTISGLLFLFVQGICNQPLIGNPPMAAFLLDTTEILHKGNRAFCDFSTLVEGDQGIGYLHLPVKSIDGTHKRVEIVHE